MIQVQEGWNYRNMISEPSTGLKLYLLFSLFTCILAGITIVRAWRFATPFRRPSPHGRVTCLPPLLALVSVLDHLIGLSFLGWGIFAAVKVVDVCRHYLDQSRIIPTGFLFVLIDLFSTLTLALFVILFLYLFRWHAINRIREFRDESSTSLGGQTP
jgi:hypothetical protein